MKDPYIQIWHFLGFQLWHRDRGGVDGACGWFMRANHGDPEVLAAIERRFALDWSNEVKTHNMGITNTALFDSSPQSWPCMSIHGIALNLFFFAALEHFRSDRKKAVSFMKRNLFDILFFAENPIDSAHHGWRHLYGVNDRETPQERIHESAVMIYGWILRADRPWYRHPRWHIHHWRISYPWKRLFSRRDQSCGVASVQR